MTIIFEIVDLLILYKTNMRPFLFQKSIPNQSVKLAEVQSEAQGHPTLLVELNRRVEGIAVNLICLLGSKPNIISARYCRIFLEFVEREPIFHFSSPVFSWRRFLIFLLPRRLIFLCHSD